MEIKDKKILQDVNFQISNGDFVCLIGKNGSGKTSLLKTICKALIPTNGNILLEGKNIKNLSYKDLARHISVVFQNTYNDLDFTVWDIVIMGRMSYQTLWQKDSKEDENLCLQALEITNTMYLKDKNFRFLSAGEQQRVLIARALCQNSEIMLLDEPVSNLDIKHQFEIMDTLKEINQRQNKTIFIILHDLSLCLQYANRVLALKEGSLIFDGYTKEILTEKNMETLFEVKAQIVGNRNIILKNNL